MKIKISLEKFTINGSQRYAIKSRFASHLLRVDFVKSSLTNNRGLFYVRGSTSRLGSRYLSEQGFQTMEEALRTVTTEGLIVADNAEAIVEELIWFGLVEPVGPVTDANYDVAAPVRTSAFDGAQVTISVTTSTGRSDMTMMLYNNNAVAAIREGKDAEPVVMHGTAKDEFKAMAQAFLRVI